MSDSEFEIPDLTPFEDAYPDLFNRLRTSGWRPGETSPAASANIWKSLMSTSV